MYTSSRFRSVPPTFVRLLVLQNVSCTSPDWDVLDWFSWVFCLWRTGPTPHQIFSKHALVFEECCVSFWFISGWCRQRAYSRKSPRSRSSALPCCSEGLLDLRAVLHGFRALMLYLWGLNWSICILIEGETVAECQQSPWNGAMPPQSTCTGYLQHSLYLLWQSYLHSVAPAGRWGAVFESFVRSIKVTRLPLWAASFWRWHVVIITAAPVIDRQCLTVSIVIFNHCVTFSLPPKSHFWKCVVHL